MRRLSAFLATVLIAATAAAADPARLHVLVTNDDGIDAPGIVALVEAIKGEYRVTVAAPFEDQSGMGHGITYRTPVLVEERPSTDGVRRFAIHAQPATCVRIAVTALCQADPPVLVLSGINRGDNAGRSTWVSGTLGGAREGALAGLPAVAFSAVVVHSQDADFAGGGPVGRARPRAAAGRRVARRRKPRQGRDPVPAGHGPWNRGDGRGDGTKQGGPLRGETGAERRAAVRFALHAPGDRCFGHRRAGPRRRVRDDPRRSRSTRPITAPSRRWQPCRGRRSPRQSQRPAS